MIRAKELNKGRWMQLWQGWLRAELWVPVLWLQRWRSALQLLLCEHYFRFISLPCYLVGRGMTNKNSDSDSRDHTHITSLMSIYNIDDGEVLTRVVQNDGVPVHTCMEYFHISSSCCCFQGSLRHFVSTFYVTSSSCLWRDVTWRNVKLSPLHLTYRAVTCAKPD